jgi:hypothetical protein
MPEQTRADGMPRFMDRDPVILLSRATERGEEFFVFRPRNHGIGRGALP